MHSALPVVALPRPESFEALVARALEPGPHSPPTTDDVLAIWQDVADGRQRLHGFFTVAGHRVVVLVPARGQTAGRLTPTERVVCRLVCAGEGNKQIAFDLDVSASTVATHLQRLMRKLGLARRTDLLVLRALCDEDYDVMDPAAPAPGVRLVSATIAGWRHTFVCLPFNQDALGQLSPAESEVAVLAATGHSNRAIASRRDSSARTVANQLASIYRKLGVYSRYELASALGRSHAPVPQRPPSDAFAEPPLSASKGGPGTSA